jgi:D-serine deaminase-like pyridoxal phosphate-dependent protein
MSSLDALATPCLLVEQGRLRRNLARMQERADANDVALRPHVKTHKSVALAGRQRKRGAAGLTVATVDEATAFMAAGAEDVRVAYPVTGRDKHERLAAQRDRARLSCTVDTAAGAEQAAAVHAAHDRPLDVLVEIDVGHGRCGVPWTDPTAAERLARRVVDLPGLRLAGLLTHAGQAYDGPSDNESEEAALRRVARQERDRMLGVATHLAEAGVPGVAPGDFEISVGSTPSMAAFENAARRGFQVTEIRPGNYVVNDAMQVGLGAAALTDCALTVLTTVVSVKERPDGPDRAFVDAGKKVFTTDTGYGTTGHGVVLRDAAAMSARADLRMVRLSEEHGWLEGPVAGALSVGERLRVVPNHACVCIATQPRLHVVDGTAVVDTWPVAGDA